MRTERESGRRRRKKMRQTCWCCRDQQRACRMAQASAEKLEHTGPAEKKRMVSVPQREQLASRTEPPLPKGKETEPQSRVPDRKEGIQCQISKENTSRRKRKRRVFLCRRTAKVKVKSKVIPTNFLKIQGRETFVGTKERKRGRLVELR